MEQRPTDVSVMRQQTLMQYKETNLNVLPTSRLHLYGTHYQSTRQSQWQEGIFLSAARINFLSFDGYITMVDQEIREKPYIDSRARKHQL